MAATGKSSKFFFLTRGAIRVFGFVATAVVLFPSLSFAKLQIKEGDEIKVNAETYEIRARIQDGGEGGAFHAVRESDHKNVVLKSLTYDDKSFEVLQNLKSHPSSSYTAVLDAALVKEKDSGIILVTEFVPALNLAEQTEIFNLEKPQELGVQEVQTKILNLDRALFLILKSVSDFANLGFVHNDIKPKNMLMRDIEGGSPSFTDLLNEKAEIKLVDFSQARKPGEIAPASTYEYEAPERRFEKVDDRSFPRMQIAEVRFEKPSTLESDLYSVGVSLAFLMLGSTQISHDHLEKRFQEIEKQIAHLPKTFETLKKLENFIKAATLRDPKKRAEAINQMSDGKIIVDGPAQKLLLFSKKFLKGEPDPIYRKSFLEKCVEWLAKAGEPKPIPARVYAD